jgi:peptide chain release factor 1
MKEKLRHRLSAIEDRFSALERDMVEHASDPQTYAQLAQEHAELLPLVQAYRAYCDLEKELAAARDLQEDPEWRDIAEEEIGKLRDKIETIESDIQSLLLPQDPNDNKNIFLEIRAGTGGDEASLFAADLFRMYARYAENRGWQVEMMSESPSEVGGYKEIIAKISGKGVYSRLKFESGVHRVQRVPSTEAQGRIHTSACTVAILPEADAIHDVEINPADLRIDTYRASGAGGQHVNRTDSAVRITHLPTGIVVECQDDRSQHKNKAKAMAVLAARILDQKIRAQHEEEASARKAQVGTGDRSERIRTYNFPQGRLTDHRINLTLYKLDRIMEGDLDELIDALIAEAQSKALIAESV